MYIRHVPPEEPIDLLNVAFENPNRILAKSRSNASKSEPRKYSVSDVDYNVPDRETGLQESEELRRLCPGRTWRFVSLSVITFRVFVNRNYEKGRSERTIPGGRSFSQTDVRRLTETGVSKCAPHR